MLAVWGKQHKARHRFHGADPAEPGPGEERLLSRRTLGITLGTSLVVGSGGITALAMAFAAAGPPGTTTVGTSFGKARISRAERQSRLPSDSASSTTHAGHGTSGGRSSQPVNMTYGDHVLVQLEVFNESDKDQMFSPGQLRLRGNSQPWLVVNRWNDLLPGLLAPGESVRANISFLVPSDATAFTALFEDIGSPGEAPVELPLPSVSWRPGFLEANHV
ncbi:hypothetical protein ACSYDW_08015 [Paeniglutamicibacter sp. R2-26]|uniref:hypothetical protein n=1 Tax=Paeniglutamicibacter sp. R2-26 TaxID=3144417 RepID=UPI003EE4DA24